MKRSLKYLVLLLLSYAYVDGQEEQLIIGRTTGELSLDDSSYTVFGFTNTLSGQVTLPGTTIKAFEGDTVTIDFWNISQGEPHALFVDSMELRAAGIVTAKETIAEVHHMDHAIYQLVADKTGYFLYYCPFNFPFNVQAGMFGLVHVQAADLENQATHEIILCSHEIDTTWHREEIMDINKDGITLLLDKYHPQHFLLNGQPMPALVSKPIIRNQTMNLHFLNAGQYQHDIKIFIANGPSESSQFSSDLYKVISLNPMASESIEVIVMDKEELSIQYEFRNMETQRIEHSEIVHFN